MRFRAVITISIVFFLAASVFTHFVVFGDSDSAELRLIVGTWCNPQVYDSDECNKMIEKMLADGELQEFKKALEQEADRDV